MTHRRLCTHTTGHVNGRCAPYGWRAMHRGCRMGTRFGRAPGSAVTRPADSHRAESPVAGGACPEASAGPIVGSGALPEVWRSQTTGDPPRSPAPPVQVQGFALSLRQRVVRLLAPYLDVPQPRSNHRHARARKGRDTVRWSETQRYCPHGSLQPSCDGGRASAPACLPDEYRYCQHGVDLTLETRSGHLRCPYCRGVNRREANRYATSK